MSPMKKLTSGLKRRTKSELERLCNNAAYMVHYRRFNPNYRLSEKKRIKNIREKSP